MADKFELTDATPTAPNGKANVKWQSDPNGNISAYVEPGAAQTPWAQDIDAAVYDLNNVGVVRFASYTTSGPVCGIGNEAGTLHALTDNGGSINLESIGTGRIMMSTDATRRLVIRQTGNVGIGPSMNPSYTLDVQGDCNISGTYRVNGTPISTGGAVSSVFTRTGAVVAASGDYTAAQVTNAVSTISSYADPTWLTSLGYSKLTGVPGSFTPSAHTHAAADTTSGVFAVARLGTGTPSASNYLRGDGAWTALPASAVTSVFTRSGAVVAASGDYTAAQVTNAVSTISSYANPAWISSLAWSKITGAPGQTPWTGNVDAAGFELRNAGNVGIGNPATPPYPDAGYVHLVVGPTVSSAVQGIITIGAYGSGALPGLNFANYANPSAADKSIAAIFGSAEGSLDSGALIFATYNAGAYGERIKITPAGNVGIGKGTPLSRLAVVGLPTSSAGLTSGDIWRDAAASNVLKIVP